MNRYIKKVAELFLPKRIFTIIQSIRSREYQKRLHKEWGVYDATHEMVARYGLTVLDGPFQRMKYPRRSLVDRDGIPILFGTYELELHPIIEEVTAKHYDRVIDIGCAEGYYAVGLACRMHTSIYAFECEPRERFYCRQMARENGVSDRVHVGGWCSRRTLKNTVVGRCLLISDCEGYEVHLFSSDVIAALKNCDLIIELHEVPGMDARGVMLERFKHSHSARLVTFDASNIGSGVPDKWRKFAREFRTPGQEWVYLTPRK